jgi:DNA-binding Lrp family transcriptional regulator
VENGLEAYVLVNIEVNSVSWDVIESVLKIEGVKTAHVVTGQFDAVVLAEFSELDDLGKIVERIHRVKGVLRTQTLLSVPSPVRAGNVMPGLAEEEKTGFDSYSDR